jgi:hypothetical protein
VTDISQVWKNPKKVELLSTYLSTKPNPTEEERSILALIPLKGEQSKELVKATQHITESAYNNLRKTGKIQDFVFAENLIDTIEPNITLSQLDKKLEKEIINIIPGHIGDKENTLNSYNKEQVLYTKLSTLPDNEKIPLQEMNGGSCFVQRNGSNYTVSIDKKTEVICSLNEVESTINSYRFLHEMGLGAIGSKMNEFLSTIEATSSLCPELDVKKGFREPQKRVLLNIVDTIFDLNMGNTMASESMEATHIDTIRKLNNEAHKK